MSPSRAVPAAINCQRFQPRLTCPSVFPQNSKPSCSAVSILLLNMASPQLPHDVTRDFLVAASTAAPTLSEAVCAANALSLHLHGALGPGFDHEKLLDHVVVEDLLSAPMKRCAVFRKCLPRAPAPPAHGADSFSALTGRPLQAWMCAAAVPVPSTPCLRFDGEIAPILPSLCALRITVMLCRSSCLPPKALRPPGALCVEWQTSFMRLACSPGCKTSPLMTRSVPVT
jgi:hypothetical protein